MTTRVVIEENDYLRLIDQMRISVPQEIKNARQIEAERDQLLATAQTQAESMLEAGRQQRDSLVAEHVVLKEAEARADEVLADAYTEAAQIRGDADAYALEVLQRIGAQLESFGRTVKNGIRLLETGNPIGSPVPDKADAAAAGGVPTDRGSRPAANNP